MERNLVLRQIVLGSVFYLLAQHAHAQNKCDGTLLQKFMANLGAVTCNNSAELECVALSHPILPFIGTLSGAGFYSIGTMTKNSVQTQAQQMSLSGIEREHLREREARFMTWAARDVDTHFKYIKGTAAEQAAYFEKRLIEIRNNTGGRDYANHQKLISALDKFEKNATLTNYKGALTAFKDLGFKNPLLKDLGAGTRLAAVARGGGVVLSSVAGAALFMTLTPSNSLSCAETVHAYSAYDESCGPAYEVSPKVSAFLELPVDRQTTLLVSEPKLCEYYTKFNNVLQEKARRNVRVTNVNCGVDGKIQVDLIENGRAAQHQLAVDSESRAVKTIYVNPSPDTKKPVDLQDIFTLHFSTDANTPGGKTKLVAATLRSDMAVERKVPTEEFSQLILDNKSKGVSRAISGFHSAQLYASGVVNCCTKSGVQQSSCFRDSLGIVETRNGFPTENKVRRAID